MMKRPALANGGRAMAPWILLIGILLAVVVGAVIAMLTSLGGSSPAYKPFDRNPSAPGGGDVVGDLPTVIDAYGRKGRYDGQNRRVAEPPQPM